MIIEKWQCSECGNNHEYEDDAQDCCKPDRPKKVYLCPECDTDYRTIDLARECFNSHNTGEPMLPTPRELEMHGQQRFQI